MNEAAETAAPARTANEVVASNIRAELGRNGSRPVDLARALGENEMWLSRRLSSKVAFSTDEVQLVADLLGVEVGELFTDHRAKKKAPALVGGGRLFVPPTGIEPATYGTGNRRSIR